MFTVEWQWDTCGAAEAKLRHEECEYIKAHPELYKKPKSFKPSNMYMLMK